MSLSGSCDRCLTTGNAGSHHGDPFRFFRLFLCLLCQELFVGLWVHHTLDRLTPAQIAKTSLHTADTQLDIFFMSFQIFFRSQRVRQGRPSHTDKVCGSVFDNMVGQVKIEDPSDGNDRNSLDDISTCFHMIDESRRRNGTRLDNAPLRGVDTLADGDGVDILPGENPGQLAAFCHLQSSRHKFIDGQFKQNRIIFSHGCPYRTDHFHAESCPVFCTSPILIISLVGKRRIKLVDEITVGSMNLHCVESTFFRPHGRVGIGLNDLLNIFFCHLPRCLKGWRILVR